MLFATPNPAQRRFDFARRSAAAPAGWLRREEAIMGTSCSVELWARDGREGAAACAAVMDEMHRIDRTMSPHRPGSELSRINREAARRAVEVSEEMWRLLQAAQRFSELSDGAFDISYAAVGRLYDYRAGVRPDAQALAAARALVGWRGIELDAARRTVRFARPGMCIDLGGFAKGHAVDNAVALLRRRGVEHAFVAAGGDSRVIGRRGPRPWTIAVRDPRREGEVVAVLPLEEVSISTSGDYERYFIERNGERHHHIVDPATGVSPRSVTSVTVLAPDGLTSEALSKCVFVLGVQRGLALAAQIDGVDAVVVDAQGALHCSAGLVDGGSLRQ